MTHDVLKAEAEEVARRLRADGKWVSYDLRVYADVAAYMLGISPDALRNRRYLYPDKKPVAYKTGKNATYYLIEILESVQKFDSAA